MCVAGRQSFSPFETSTVPLANTKWSWLIWVTAGSDRSSQSAGLMAVWFMGFTRSRNVLCDTIAKLIIHFEVHGFFYKLNSKTAKISISSLILQKQNKTCMMSFFAVLK